MIEPRRRPGRRPRPSAFGLKGAPAPLMLAHASRHADPEGEHMLGAVIRRGIKESV